MSAGRQRVSASNELSGRCSDWSASSAVLGCRAKQRLIWFLACFGAVSLLTGCGGPALPKPATQPATTIAPPTTTVTTPTSSGRPTAPYWRLEVTGDARKADIVYSLDGSSQNEGQDDSDLTLPWSKTVDGFVRAGNFEAGRGVQIGGELYDTVQIVASPSGGGPGTLTCTITDTGSGEVVARQTRTFSGQGGENSLQCDGQKLIP